VTLRPRFERCAGRRLHARLAQSESPQSRATQGFARADRDAGSDTICVASCG